MVKFHNTGRYEVTEDVPEVSTHTHTPMYTFTHIHSQLKGYDRLKFFKESETYWSPATTTSGLYAQLYENKYRELPREQIR